MITYEVRVYRPSTFGWDGVPVQNEYDYLSMYFEADDVHHAIEQYLDDPFDPETMVLGYNQILVIPKENKND